MDMSNTDEADYMSKDSSISEGVDIDWVFNPNIDLIEHTVEDFRKQRISMVQSLKQYVLCYETVLEWVSQQHRAGRRERSGSESLASNDR
jgi:protein-tyrosine phosphatase